MSDYSRRDFLKVTVVGAAVAAEGCGDPAAPAGGAQATPPDPGPGTGGSTGAKPRDAGSPPAPSPADAAAPAPDTAAATADASVAGPDAATASLDAAVLDPMPSETTGTAGMPLRALGKTGLMVSIVGFGSGSQYLAASEAEAERLVHRAVELGVSYFDTAASYGAGASQRRLGKYLVPTHRSKVVLASKTLERTAEGAKRELDQALTSLGTDKLDIFHFHEIGSSRDVDAILAKGGAYEVLQRAKEQGVIRFIGLTGHSSGAILVDALRRIKPDVTMCPQNAARELGFTAMVLPYGRDNGIGLLGMKVTAQDALLRNGVKADELVRYSLSLPVSAMIIGMSSMAVLESCATIAKTLTRMTPAQMMQVTGKLASLDLPRCVPYRHARYRDGACWG